MMKKETVLVVKEKLAVAESSLIERDGHAILDQFGRTFDYLRIAVNEKCNLRCIYCMPEEGVDFTPDENLLKADEIIRIINIVAKFGVKKLRFTGGEPLLNKDIVYLISNSVIVPGIESVHLTTNGLLLEKYAVDLSEAGLHGINISLDTLNHQKFYEITRRDKLDLVLDALQIALKLPFNSVKINVVVMRNFNHTEIGDFVELTKDNLLTVRFIELMPFDAHQIWRTGKFFGADKIVEELKTIYLNLTQISGSSTEHYVYQLPGYKGKFGVIPSFTRNICQNCNRIRLTADGKIRNCLYSDHEFNLRKLIRDRCSDEEIGQLLKNAMWQKLKDGYEAQNHSDHHRESMTQIGG
ncbi:MAG: GTP 3',8-cyclase MoaA [Candidatus Marinimicrobia bacterium]|nr:GTP 3',8-cyclase MoaA [Candidatus Neomarinimicrobiota bacterium]